MSLAAYIWAAELPLNACGPTAYRVLLKLADGADDLGYCTWKSPKTMAEGLGCSERTVQRALAELTDAGLIRAGDQRHVQHIRADRRPMVYDVITTAMAYRESMTQRAAETG